MVGTTVMSADVLALITAISQEVQDVVVVIRPIQIHQQVRQHFVFLCLRQE